MFSAPLRAGLFILDPIHAPCPMFRQFRILILLLVLAGVGLSTWRSSSRLTAWEHTVHVALYPLAADDSPATARYIAQLTPDSFADIAEWAQEESRRYGREVLQPVSVHVASPRSALPPLPPLPGASAFDIGSWSLKFRWWAWRNDTIDGPKPQVRLFLLFHDPARTGSVPHSTGLEKGQLGLVHVYASTAQRRQNNVIIAHELLHTFGATDKYDLVSGLPHHPDGYAEPDRQPRYPQAFTEIMGGRRPTSEREAEIPRSLAATLIGPATAREIGLLRSTGKNR